MNTKKHLSKIKSVLNEFLILIKKIFKRKKVDIAYKSENTSSSKFIFLRRFGIKTRLIVSFVLLLVVVLLITGISSYNSSTGTIDDKVKRYSLQVMDQTSVILENKIDRMEAYINDIGLDRNIQNAIVNYNSESDYERLEQIKIINEYLMTKFVDGSEVEYCALLHDKDFSRVESFKNGQADINIENIAKTDFKRLQWTYLDFVQSSKPVSYYGIAQNIKGVTIGGTIAKMVLVPKPNFLASGFVDLDIGKDSHSDKAFPIFVVNGDGNILATRNEEDYAINSSNDNSKLIASEIKKKSEENSKIKSANIDINIGGVDSLVTYSKLGNRDWYVASIIPYEYLNSSANDLRNNIIAIGLICIIFALLLCVFIARSVSKPLSKLVLAMQMAKDGDLTHYVSDNGKDEIVNVCNNYNDMLSNISSLIHKVKSASTQVFEFANKITTASESTYSVSEQIAESIGEMSSGASDQASEISDSVSDINKLSDGIALVEGNVAQVITIADKITGLNKNASSTINALNEKSSQVSVTTSNVYANINELNKSMKEIQKILKMQNSISEQTNLLALNAAIEAARAGDAGKGFAVVASEVTKLADKSKEFNTVINNIIGSIGKKTEDTVQEVLKSNDVVNEQINAVKDTEKLFETVFGSMKDVVANIEITEKSVGDIMNSKNNVLESIENISTVAQQSAAATEEISASTQEQITSAEELANRAKDLEDLAETLNKEIMRFKI